MPISVLQIDVNLQPRIDTLPKLQLASPVEPPVAEDDIKPKDEIRQRMRDNRRQQPIALRQLSIDNASYRPDEPPIPVLNGKKTDHPPKSSEINEPTAEK